SRASRRHEASEALFVPMILRDLRGSSRLRDKPAVALLLSGRAAREANLLGVVVGVRRVDLEPAGNGVAAVLAVRPLARPLRFAHPLENLRRRAPRRLERFDRGVDRPVVVQPPRKLVLVVADDLRIVDGDQMPEPDCRRHLAVGEVMRDLACGPLGWRWPRVELFIGGAGERVGDNTVAVLVLVDESIACNFVHFISPAFLLSPARRLPAPKPARDGARSGERVTPRTPWSACRRTGGARDPFPRSRPIPPSA